MINERSVKWNFIIFFFFGTSLSSYGQLRISTPAPCNDSMLLNITGRWVKGPDLVYNDEIKLTRAQQQEVINRIDALHTLFREAYPRAMGADAPWHRSFGYSLFGNEVKYYKNRSDVLTRDFIKGVPVCSFNYTCAIYPYYCSNTANKSEAVATYPGESGTIVHIYANDLQALHARKMGDDTMTLNGLPVYKRHPAKETWKGYELLYEQGGPDERYVLIHRKGILPYIPVTRKQYLDHCLSYLNTLFDDMIKGLDLVQDQQQREEFKKMNSKNKIVVLKRYQDELERTTRAGLLDSPAIILEMHPVIEIPIFTTEAEGGAMLVTENPAYMRKDLPKYIPQLFIINWSWMRDKPSHEFKEMLEANFPVEKLQAMIDK